MNDYKYSTYDKILQFLTPIILIQYYATHVTYTGNGHTSGAPPTNFSYFQKRFSTTITPQGTLDKTGHNFIRWNTQANGSGTSLNVGQTITPTSSLTLYAQWQVSYQITYDGNGQTSGTPPTQPRFLAGQNINIAGGNTLARTNFLQSGWNTQPDGSGTFYVGGAGFVMPANNFTLYAQWIPTYTIIYDGNGHTSGTPPVQPARYLPAQSAPVQSAFGAVFKTGFAPRRWNTQPDGSGTSYEFGSNLTLPASDVTLYVEWATSYSVTYIGNGSTSGTPPDNLAYAAGNLITFPLPQTTLSKPGYLAYHWNTAPDGSGTRYANTLQMPAQNLTLYPEWVRLNEGGDGTVGNPYLISNPEQLHHVRANLSAHYKLINDIDLTTFLLPNTHGFNNGAFWSPIGNPNSPFSGSFDGNYKKIKGLKIMRSTEDYVGLFGLVTAETAGNEIARLGLEIDIVGVWGNSYVGGLIGWGYVDAFNIPMDITACYVEGGGVVGSGIVGKLIGYYDLGSVKRCYAKGSPIYTSESGVGGLVGTMDLNIENSYAQVQIIGINNSNNGSIGGISGTSFFGIDNIANSYAVMPYSVSLYTGGIATFNSSGIYTNNFYDKQVNSYQYDLGGTGLNTAQMKTASTFTNAGWDFTNVWGIDPTKNNGYPYLRYQYEYSVSYLAPDRTNGNLPTDNTRYAQGANATVLGAGTMTRVGYCLSGWNTKADGTGTSYAVGSVFALPAQNVTLYAQWGAPLQATIGTIPNVAVGSTSFQVPYTLTGGTATHYSLTSDLPNFVAVSNATLSGSPIVVTLPTNQTVGTFNFTVTLRNNAGGCEVVTSFAVTFTGTPANAIDFDGVNDYGSIANNGTLNPSAFTIDTWIKWGRSGTAIDFICSKADEVMEIHTGGVVGNNIRFIPVPGVYLDGGTDIIAPNTWVHIAAVYDPSQSLAKLYINGADIPLTKSGSNPLNTPVPYTASSFILGSRHNLSFPFKGQMDNFRLWYRILSQTEIQAYSHCGIAPSLSALSVDIQINQGFINSNNTAVTALTDASGVGNQAVLNNFAWAGTSSNFVLSNATDVAFGANLGNVATVSVGTTSFSLPYTLICGAMPTQYRLSSNLPNFVAVPNTALSGSPLAVFLPANLTIGTFNFVLTLRNATSGFEIRLPFVVTITDNALSTERRGNALKLNGTNQYAITSSVLSSAANNVTTEAWVKQNALPPTGQRALIFYHGNPLAGGYGLFIDHLGKLIVWHEGINIVDIGVSMPLGTWVHVAHTINSANTMSVYVNGKAVTSFNLGAYPPTEYFRIGNEYWAGEIDEVRFWNVARTADEIRATMHLTLPTGAANLTNYYQFNDLNATFANDWVGNVSANFVNTPIRVGSGANVSKGTSFTISTPTAGTDYGFTGTGVTLNFGNSNGGGNIVVSRLEGLPTGTQVSGVSSVYTRYYWVVNNFGTTNTGLNVTATFVLGAGQVSAGDETNPTNLKLNKRPSNLGGAWSTVINGSSATASTGTVQFTGIDGFSEFVMATSGSSPLPITLVGWKGKRVEGLNGELTEEVKLEWTTASEINNKGFEIQVSENAQTYKTIAFIDGKGNAGNIYHLSFINANDVYVRLRQVDFDGKFSYSPIVFVEGLAGKVLVYPNPNNGTFTITSPLTPKGEITQAKLFNAQGIESPLTPEGGIFRAKDSLPNGIYFLHTVVAGKVKVTKIIIQK